MLLMTTHPFPAMCVFSTLLLMLLDLYLHPVTGHWTLYFGLELAAGLRIWHMDSALRLKVAYGLDSWVFAFGPCGVTPGE